MAAVGSFKDAEQSFLLIENEKLKYDFVYLSWLARCFIRNNKARLAWELYLKLEQSTESFNLLQLIANDCYKVIMNKMLITKLIIGNFKIIRWDTFIMQQEHLISWREWIRIQSIGKAKEARVQVHFN